MRFYNFQLEGGPEWRLVNQLAAGGYDFAAPLFELDISIGAADQHGSLGYNNLGNLYRHNQTIEKLPRRPARCVEIYSVQWAQRGAFGTR